MLKSLQETVISAKKAGYRLVFNLQHSLYKAGAVFIQSHIPLSHLDNCKEERSQKDCKASDGGGNNSRAKKESGRKACKICRLYIPCTL